MSLAFTADPADIHRITHQQIALFEMVYFTYDYLFALASVVVCLYLYLYRGRETPFGRQ